MLSGKCRPSCIDLSVLSSGVCLFNIYCQWVCEVNDTLASLTSNFKPCTFSIILKYFVPFNTWYFYDYISDTASFWCPHCPLSPSQRSTWQCPETCRRRPSLDNGALRRMGWVCVAHVQHISGLVQDCSISIALAMEIPQSCTKPSIYPWVCAKEM